MKFVYLYREECLWNINSSAYKLHEARDETLKEICGEMNIDGFGICEDAQKIKNIQSAHYREIKKNNGSKKFGALADDIYRAVC